MVTANGQMLDLRYKVLDPERAAVLFRRDAKAYLIDEATGKEVPIAVGTKVGHLRQYSDQPQAGKIYFILFANRERAIKAGAKVTICIGDFRAEHLTVE